MTFPLLPPATERTIRNAMWLQIMLKSWCADLTRTSHKPKLKPATVCENPVQVQPISKQRPGLTQVLPSHEAAVLRSSSVGNKTEG